MVKKATKDIKCSKCNSYNIVQRKLAGYTLIISILFLGLPFLFFNKSYYCFDCENEWK